ncbi:hypothetical protein ACFC0C_16445 [Streptomyces sp. NPDC056178]|uniref:hypothetical protein n=1 Tax=unclassified Streptomyces TaxID=2593676 RepID=UPI0035D785AB
MQNSPSPKHEHLFDLPSLPEQLLGLAGSFTRHNDALSTLSAGEPESGAALRKHIPSTHALGRQTLDVMDSAERLLHPTPAAVEAGLRLRQLAFLTTGAVDELLGALDLVEAGANGADTRLQLAKELTLLGPEAAVGIAERLAVEMRPQRVAPEREGTTRLSPPELTALRAVARGEVQVTKMLGKQYVSSHGTRLSIATIRTLESKELLKRDKGPQEALPQRLILTAAGDRALADVFGQSPVTTPAIHPAPNPSNAPSAAVSRSR